MPKFNVVRFDTKRPTLCRIDGTPILFENGVDAQQFADDQQKTTGIKHQPRQVKADISWKNREQSRFDNGEYIYIIWRSRWLSFTDFNVHDHYAHVAKTVRNKVSFTETPEKGAADIQTTMSPGRYIERFFASKYAGLSARVIHDLAMNFLADYQETELHFAVTEDEIDHVYHNGPDSCMSDDAGYPKRSCVHPVRVYAAGDLQVAYITGADDEVSARALVWPAKMTHSRCYGKPEFLSRLLQKAGYSAEPPIGARLLKIYDSHRGEYVLPYLDAGHEAGCGSLYAEVHSDHLTIVSFSSRDRQLRLLRGDNTYGLGTLIYEGGDGDEEEDDDDSPICQNCDERCDNTSTVWVLRNNCEEWCDSCRSDYAVYCEDENTYVHSDNAVCMYDGDKWASNWWFDNNGVRCEHSDINIHEDNAVAVRVPEEDYNLSYPYFAVQTWWSHIAETKTGFCAITNYRYVLSALVTLEDGRRVGFDTAEGQAAIALRGAAAEEVQF